MRYICRLEARGLKVLVERAVHSSEFPEYSAYNPDLGGAPTLMPMNVPTLPGRYHVLWGLKSEACQTVTTSVQSCKKR